jgi:mono/diheme cytochrome c family protein
MSRRPRRALGCVALIGSAAWLLSGAPSAVGFLRVDAQSLPTSPRRGGNPEAAKLQRPGPAPADAVASGQRTYQRLCVRCHGREGRGDGAGAGSGGQPADFTDDVWLFGGTPGEIFTVIRDGTSADMDSYAAQISEADMWNLVDYVRSFAPPDRQP